MQFYSIRLRGKRMIEINHIPGNAKFGDIKEIVSRECGGRLRVAIFFRGEAVADQSRLTLVLSDAEPANDGRFYFFYETLRRNTHSISITTNSRATRSKISYLIVRDSKQS